MGHSLFPRGAVAGVPATYRAGLGGNARSRQLRILDRKLVLV